jgi:hypothetical protein
MSNEPSNRIMEWCHEFKPSDGMHYYWFRFSSEELARAQLQINEAEKRFLDKIGERETAEARLKGLVVLERLMRT